MRHNGFPRAGRIIALAVMFPLSALIAQQTSKQQNPQPTGPSSSVLNLNFGPTATTPEGRSAAERLLLALGGPTKVNAVKTLRQIVVGSQQGQRIEIDQTIVYPNKQAQRMILPQGKMVLVVTPADAFMVQGGRVQELSATQRAALDATLKHDFINILQHINDPKYIFAAVGRENVSGAEATIVDVEADGIPTRWWVGIDGKLLQERYSDMSTSGNMQTMTYSDWKNFGGLLYPTKYDLLNSAGQTQLSMILTRMEVNATPEARIFQRPSGY